MSIVILLFEDTKQINKNEEKKKEMKITKNQIIIKIEKNKQNHNTATPCKHTHLCK